MAKTDMSPPLTKSSHENKLIALAMKQAEKQLRDGTASSQIITHYLKLGTKREEVEMERLELENQLLSAKIEAADSEQNLSELYSNVLSALQSYTVQRD